MIILETDRLTLRRLVPDDLDALYALYRDPEMRQYFPVEGASPDRTLTREETKEELDWFLDGHPKHPELGLWATILKETGKFIGRCGLCPMDIEGKEEIEVAYMLDSKYWGQGLATEAAQAILHHGFERVGVKRLICVINPNNIASARVAEKIGMRLEIDGDVNGEPTLLYTLNKP